MTWLRYVAVLSIGSTMLIAAEPAWKNELSSTKPGSHPALPPGTLEFEISWKGILQSGKVTMEIGKTGAHKPDTLIVRSTATSMGVAAAIFPYDGRSWTEMNAGSLTPIYFSSWERCQGETIKSITRFHENQVTSEQVTQKIGNHKKEVEQHEFLYGPVFEISSALLHIRSQKLKDGDRISLLVHPFNSPYLLQAKVLGREKHLGKDSIKLSVEMRKIDRKTLQLKPYKKLKKAAHLWLSDDLKRLPLELRAEAFIGDIRASLTGFQPPEKRN